MTRPDLDSADLDALELVGPAPQVGVGVVVPYDMALDRELWRWTPPEVSLHFTRTPFAPLPVTVEMAEHVADGAGVRAGVQDLQAVAPAAYAYACTSGSFVNGVSGERRLTETMRAAGAPAAVTTSGALLAALAALGVSRVAVATPYEQRVNDRLAHFLGEAGVTVEGSSHLGMTTDIWKVPYARTGQLVIEADDDRAQAVVVACTNLPTYDVVAPLERRLGKPVVTANQATMWAVLREVGRTAAGAGQLISR
ncbi:MAG TPA: Asp/Glu/hydantoin racemase [Actinomycetales bacterium]|nr:Asp/Glu/hydantoin racemase [Actinomycetales bacterium]